MKTLTAFAICCTTLLATTGCASKQGIVRDDDEVVETMDLNYSEMVELAGDMANLLVGNPHTFLMRDPHVKNLPVLMVLSDIDNQSGIRDLPVNQITGRVRSACLNSGKIQFVSSFGDGKTDSTVQNAQDVSNDPRFNQENVPDQGSLDFPVASLNTTINKINVTDGNKRQNTYVIHMFVSDIKTGRILWEEFSDNISKSVERGGVGF